MTLRSAKFAEAMESYSNDRTEDALRLMEECARGGDPVACHMVALWYRNGEGTPASLEQSEKWVERLERLAAEGDAEAQWELGQNHKFGDLVPLNIERANFWLERAAENGWAEAQHHLAWYLETGQYDYAIDPALAQSWYQRSFEQGHPETLYLYAIRAFRDGQPMQEAIGLLARAADKGFKQAADVLKSYTH